MLTDGKKRNSSGVWSGDGKSMAYCRVDADDNGAFTQIRTVPPTDPEQDRLVAQVPGGGWGILDWSSDDSTLLAMEYISINESYLWTIDRESGERKRLTEPPRDEVKVSYGGGQWSADGKAIYTTTDIGGEFRQLYSVDLKSMTSSNLSESIPWDVSQFDLSPDGETIAFATNEAGISRTYLLDVQSKQLKQIEIPIGIVSALKWHPTDNEIAINGSVPRLRRLMSILIGPNRTN